MNAARPKALTAQSDMDPVSGSLHLKKKRDKPVDNRHPWVFSGAISRVEGQPAPGDLVEIVAADGRWLARGYYNPHSQIRARILSWDANTPIDRQFWQSALVRSVAMRRRLALPPQTTAFRLVNGEADGLPGLIVDQYDRFLVMQCLTMGIDRRKELLIQRLIDEIEPLGIVERSDVQVREQEGLPQVAALLWGEKPPAALQVRENGHLFNVDLLNGQKTGLYLDQRENRELVSRSHLVQGRRVLNAFSYTGGFAVYAAANGAAAITNLDASAQALAEAEKNLALNGFQRPQDEYIAGDAFQILRHYRDNGRQFDMIILDPPKFAHSKRDVQPACRGYKDLNWLAMRLLTPGGLLATFSCSGLVSADLFQKVLFGAAVDAGRQVQILTQMGQSADHPILLTFPESAYLKGFLCHVD